MSATVATAGTTDRSSLLVRGGLGIALGMALNGILILGAVSLAYAEGVRALTLPPVLSSRQRAASAPSWCTGW